MTADRGSARGFDWASLPPAALAAYLGRQRWSGARGADVADVRVAAWVPFPLPAGEGAACAITLVEGRVGGAPVRWQLPLVALATLVALPGDAGAPDPVAVLGDVRLWDATAHAPFRDALRDALARGRELPGRTSEGRALRWVAHRVGDRPTLDAPHPARVGGAEQSNTSLIFGDAAIVKLFRRLEAGPQPDVEIGRALAEARFAHVPALLAVAELVEGETRTVLGMAQALVPRARDAWEVAVASARAAVGAAADDAREAALAAAEGEARRLGTVTRRLHDALAAVPGEAFAPAPATAADVRRWAGDTARAFELALEAVAEPGTGDATPAFMAARAALGALAARGADLRARVDALVDRIGGDAGLRVRHHGDYHLGQVLRGDDGTLAVIDFEGEPARPLAERRARHSPLRDVAGMLRSFGYAAAAAMADAGPAAAASARGAAWEAVTRTAFLAGYFEPVAEPGSRGAAPDRPAYLPRRRDAADALVRLFELEKLFYELRYEVRNRPDWLQIPLRGLTALLQATDPGAAAAASIGEAR